MWGIPGNVGEIYRKQQSDELKDQLLKQEMAQRIRAFEADQEYRKQQMAAQAEERAALERDRAANRADQLTQRQRQGAFDAIGLSTPGPTTDAFAGPISAYAPTAGLITRRNVLPAQPMSGPVGEAIRAESGITSREDTSGPQNFAVREPTPAELETTKERVRTGELKKILGGVNRADPGWRQKAAAAMSEIDPKAAFTQLMEQTPEERRIQHQQDIADSEAATRRNASFQEGLIRSRPQTGVQLTEGGIDAAARQYATTGVLPALGMGASGDRKAIINRAAELSVGLNPGASAASFTADRGSLTNITKQLDAITAYEGTALKNLDVFLGLAKKVTDTGSPYLNRPLRSIDERVLGSADLAAFRAARDVVLPEFSRIINNPNLSGQLTDDARKEIASLSGEEATIAQILSVANVLKQDAANRKDFLSAQRDVVRGRIQQIGAPQNAPSPTPPPASGGVTYQDYLNRRKAGGQ